MYKSKGNSWLKHLDFILVDMLWLLISLAAAFFIREYLFSYIVLGQSGNAFIWKNSFYSMLLIVYPLTHLFLVLVYGAYSGVLRRGPWTEFGASIMHNALIFAIVVTYMYVRKVSSISARSTIIMTFAFSTVLMFVSRMIMKKIINRRRRRTKNSGDKFLIMSDSVNAERTVKTVLSHNNTYADIFGVIVCDRDMKGQTVGGIPVVASGDDWREFMLSNVVDEVIVNLEDLPEVGEMLQYINTLGITAHLVLNIERFDVPIKVVQEFDGFTVISTSLNTANTRQRIIKRAADIFFGLIGTLIVIVLTVIIGPLIFLEDRGPIFFLQKRVGRNGRVFRIIKYRTMYTDAEERKKELMKQNEMNGLMFKMKDDPRVTKIGGFLRKTSIDELPQFINILFGSMSLVGTRPPTLDEFRQYEAHHKVRLGITPGLTGMWQVSGRSEITDFEEIVRLDEQYIREWRLLLDLKIILKTFVVVLKREGAE